MNNDDIYTICVKEENKKHQDQSESVIKLLVYEKHSETYNANLSTLLKTKASDLDHKTQEILKKFDHSPKNEYFTEKKIKNWPNLFSASIESAEYIKYLNIMYEISKSKLLTPSILQYLISYLEKVDLEDESCIKNHHMITILHMLLYFFYGENGCNFFKGNENSFDKNTKRSEIGKYLSDLDVSLQDKIEPIFLRTCDFLKNLLHHKKYRILNFKARDICHHFSIKLDLSLMIRLCIEGVRLENEDIENLVLFIGNSGSGKSTTINYLYGIVYRLICSMKTQNYFLKQVDENVIAPAKVGHGNVSETLFPKIIPINGRKLSFCDFPGLNDTRDEEYKTCASLGLPIAVHFAKKQSIGAIVVVIDWETIKIDRGEKLLNTIKTVKSLMKDMRNDSVKLLYAITRPPIPPDDKYRERNLVESTEDDDDDDEYCDSDRLKEKVFEELRSNLNNLTDEYNVSKQENDPKIKKLNDTVEQLQFYIVAISKLLKSLFDGNNFEFKYNDHFNFEKGNKTIIKNTIINDLKIKLDKMNDSFGQTTIELLDKHIDKIFLELEDKKTHSAYELKRIIYNLTDIETQLNIDKIGGLRQNINDINKKLKEKKSLINFLENIELDDIYIIRGFKLEVKSKIKDQQDSENSIWEDHKENLLKRIEEICNENNNNPSDYKMQMDYRSQRFTIVLDWTKGESNRIKTLLDNLLKGIEKIEKLKLNIKELEDRIQEDEKNLKLSLVSSRDNENEIMENTEKKLNSLNEKKEKVDKELEQTFKDIDEMKKSIQEIEESPAIEYGSKTFVDKRNKLTQLLGVSTFYSYTFPKVYYEKSWNFYDWLIGELKTHNLPIDRVEISYLINKEEKIIFKTPFASNSIENQIDPNSITNLDSIKECNYTNNDRIKVIVKNKNQSDFKYTGEILISNENLDQGDFKITYFSHDGEDGFIGVRCYVKPIHFPENKLKIENFKIKISEKEKEKTELEKQLEDVNNEIKENEDYYECVRVLYDEKKGKYLLKFLIDLEYSPDDFFDILLKEIKEEEGDKADIEWLEKDENLKEVKKAFANYDVMKDHFIDQKQMPKNLLQSFIFSKDETKEIEDLKKKEQFEADKFDFQRLLRLYKISKKSGLSFIVLRQIVKSLRDQKNTKGRFLKRTLKEEIEKLMNSVNSFEKEKKLFEKREWVIDVLETVVEVLSYRDLESYIEFRKAKESYDATDFITVLESANNIIKRDNQTSN